MIFTMQLILTLLSSLLSSLLKSNAPAEIIAGVQSALNELTKVHGTLVTKVQIDSLLDEPRW